eukprot:SAG31_NODE_11041_length_1072_cov_0.907503_1_plen_96_part_10
MIVFARKKGGGACLMSLGGVLAVVGLATRQDIGFASVYLWAIIAIVLRNPDGRAASGFSCVGIVAPLTLLVAARSTLALIRGGGAAFPPLVFPLRG